MEMTRRLIGSKRKDVKVVDNEIPTYGRLICPI
jgi:hypothetical protein